MRQSHLFTKARKEAPKDETAGNAQLLIRAGYVYKEMAGVYSYLPLGLRVLNKIEQIIREEINAIGGQELILTALQEKDAWEKTGRWDDAVVDNWFKTKLKNDTELGLAYTHESAITALMKDYVNSYRDLPMYAYQFQTKFRNELRAKSGLFRGREFRMKDLYSFSRTQAELDAFYEQAIGAYHKIFARLGLGDITYLTLASGGTFGTKYSHEFQTLTAAGEDLIYIHDGKKIAINKEVLNDETLAELGIDRADLREEKAVEVGNIYKLGTFYSEPLGLQYTDEDGTKKSVIMGSYGIGPSRVMGTIVEVHHDDKGIVWPEAVAPFRVHVLALGDDPAVQAQAESVVAALEAKNIEVLFDDRPGVTPGQKLNEADLLGMPHRLVVSAKTGENVEWKRRTEADSAMVPLATAIEELTK
jgi:prolyl-tRNA synthetase